MYKKLLFSEQVFHFSDETLLKPHRIQHKFSLENILKVIVYGIVNNWNVSINKSAVQIKKYV